MAASYLVFLHRSLLRTVPFLHCSSSGGLFKGKTWLRAKSWGWSNRTYRIYLLPTSLSLTHTCCPIIHLASSLVFGFLKWPWDFPGSEPFTSYSLGIKNIFFIPWPSQLLFTLLISWKGSFPLGSLPWIPTLKFLWYWMLFLENTQYSL